MADAPREIEDLIELMARLPGLGPRSARRAVLHLVKKRGLLLMPLADAMQSALVGTQGWAVSAGGAHGRNG